MNNYKSVLMGRLSEVGLYYEESDSIDKLKRIFRENGDEIPDNPESDSAEDLPPEDDSQDGSGAANAAKTEAPGSTEVPCPDLPPETAPQDTTELPQKTEKQIITELQIEYEQKFFKNLPPRFKNDKEWILKKLKE